MSSDEMLERWRSPLSPHITEYVGFVDRCLSIWTPSAKGAIRCNFARWKTLQLADGYRN
jgi:hypothetical protein